MRLAETTNATQAAPTGEMVEGCLQSAKGNDNAPCRVVKPLLDYPQLQSFVARSTRLPVSLMS
jgi:hypothetical protein